MVIVGTPLYKEKYENRMSSTGSVVAAEMDLVNQRLIGTEEEKRTVLPVLLYGDERASFPPMVRGKVYADLRNDARYLESVVDLVLSIRKISPRDSKLSPIREAIRSTISAA